MYIGIGRARLEAREAGFLVIHNSKIGLVLLLFCFSDYTVILEYFNIKE